jgi:predicted YcjX-like family ATPase
MSHSSEEPGVIAPSQEADQVDLRSIAVTFIDEAFAEAQRDGLDGDCLAHAALFAAFRELVATYGEDATAVFAETLADKVRAGAYTTATRH